MHTDGWFLPESEADARDRYEALAGTAQLVVREVTKAMNFDREEYDTRVTSDVVETALDVLFAEQLAVTIGTTAEFEDWKSEHGDGFEVSGSANVEHVVWHSPSFTEGVAATFQNEAEAATGTLRRQAFGNIYRDVV